MQYTYLQIRIFKMRKTTHFYANGKDSVDKKKKMQRRGHCRDDVLV